MSAADICAEDLRSGLTPPQIAAKQGLSLSKVFEELNRAVGDNLISRSEIYFSIDGELRAKVEESCRVHGYRPTSAVVGSAALEPLAADLTGEDTEQVLVCLRYGPASRYYGDLYELIRKYELDYHHLTRDVLIREYGLSRRAWWYLGVPVGVRQGCAARAEELADFDRDPWTCSYLIDIASVLKDQWRLFEALFKVPSKNDVFAEIRSVNEVRNRVMHPVRDDPPTDADFDTLRSAYYKLQVVRERFYGADQAASSRSQ